MSCFARAATGMLIAALLLGADPVWAQAASSPAKKELVQKVLTLQQSGIEAIGNQLASQAASQRMQAAGQALGRVPAEKRDAVAKELQAEVRKFYDEVAPLLRDRAVKLAPSTVGTALEEKFSEDELKSLVAWLESPVSRKYQQLASEMQQSLTQKVVADSRAQVEPKLKALDQVLSSRLNAATGESKPSGGAAKGTTPAPKK
jgi:hypothetical protein